MLIIQNPSAEIGAEVSVFADQLQFCCYWHSFPISDYSDRIVNPWKVIKSATVDLQVNGSAQLTERESNPAKSPSACTVMNLE